MIGHSLAIPAVAALLCLSMASGPLAAPAPQIQLGLQFGTPDYGNPDNSVPDQGDCLSDPEIYGALRDQGYSRPRLISDDGDTLDFFARRGTRLYELTVDSCSGDVVDRHRVWHY